MLTVNIYEAKTHFSKLIETLQANNEDIIIAKAGKPIARLSPIRKEKLKRIRGLLKGQICLGPEFDEPLPEDILNAFEGEHNTNPLKE